MPPEQGDSLPTLADPLGSLRAAGRQIRGTIAAVQPHPDIFEAKASKLSGSFNPVATATITMQYGNKPRMSADHPQLLAPPLIAPSRSKLPTLFYAVAIGLAVCALWFSSFVFSASIALPAIFALYLQQRDYARRMRMIGEAVVAEAKYVRATRSFTEYEPYFTLAKRSLISHGVEDLILQLPQR